MSIVIPQPKMVVLFSGKRKCGKDTITDLIYDRVKSIAVIIKISAPIKLHFSKSKGLNFSELMSSSEYKENFRLEMINWSEKVRKSDYGYFCRAAVEMSSATEKPVWIVTDMRRQTDLQWFRENYKNIITVRVHSSEEERLKRGWKFTTGIDNEETECDLDSIQDWDIVVKNNGTLLELQTEVDSIVERINQAVESAEANTIESV